MKEYEVLVGYNRGCNLEIDYHKIIRVVAGSPKEASELVDNYRIDK